MNFHTEDDLFAACGAGDIRTMQVVNAAQRQVEPEEESVPELRTRPKSSRNEGDIIIHGVGNLLTQMAGCCHPLPGDPIIGYITQGRGVTIHRSDCVNALQLQEQESERLIEVNWGDSKEQTYPVEVQIEAYDRSGLLRGMLPVVLANERVNVLDLKTHISEEDNIATVLLTIEISTLDDLGSYIDPNQSVVQCHCCTQVSQGTDKWPDTLWKTLLHLMARLRDPETGCPWDLRQDFTSIAPYTVEEAHEVADAIASADYPHLEEELGDLLFSGDLSRQNGRRTAVV